MRQFCLRRVLSKGTSGSAGGRTPPEGWSAVGPPCHLAPPDSMSVSTCSGYRERWNSGNGGEVISAGCPAGASARILIVEYTVLYELYICIIRS